MAVTRKFEVSIGADVARLYCIVMYCTALYHLLLNTFRSLSVYKRAGLCSCTECSRCYQSPQNASRCSQRPPEENLRVPRYSQMLPGGFRCCQVQVPIQVPISIPAPSSNTEIKTIYLYQFDARSPSWGGSRLTLRLLMSITVSDYF